MKKGKKATGGVIGLVLLCCGALLCLTLVGALVGVPMILLGLHFGMKRKAVLACAECGAEVDRKVKWYEYG